MAFCIKETTMFSVMYGVLAMTPISAFDRKDHNDD
jgi:hypothetical protein